MDEYGFLRVAAASPRLKVANPEFNAVEIEQAMAEAHQKGAVLLVLPELCLTGYTCGDLFFQETLLTQTREALSRLLEKNRDINLVTILGLPLQKGDHLYNCAAVLSKGRILGVVPKMYLPNYKEFYEKRWFSAGTTAHGPGEEIELLGSKIPFGNLIFRCRGNKDGNSGGFSFGIEICEDLWTPVPPSAYMALHGADFIVNPSASNELVAKSEYRRQLVAQQSARCLSGYVYASAGVHESTTDVVFSGECLICENGIPLAVSKRFSRERELVLADLDLEVLRFERRQNKSFADNIDYIGKMDPGFSEVCFPLEAQRLEKGEGLIREVNKNPFVPANPVTMQERCEEIFSIQVAGLAKRLEHTGIRQAVIGVSGGLDSTLALLVTRRTFDLLGLDPQNILAVTMPGFGTTGETRNNARDLMEALGVSIREIDIKEACLQHFRDIGHDPAVLDTTYENVQARERTQILMDMANKGNGLVIGTGDLSELALGWATYNGDHMSMYAVNCSIPKTLVKFLVSWVAEHVMDEAARPILKRILDTPISPELLPPDREGKIQQKTESLIGPYELHDFFLFYTLRYGMRPGKILYLAARAYGGHYSREEIKNWLRLFYKRFFQNQFKRSCLPDGPKVGSVSLSPRGDWRMPSDADSRIWLKELEDL